MKKKSNCPLKLSTLPERHSVAVIDPMILRLSRFGRGESGDLVVATVGILSDAAYTIAVNIPGCHVFQMSLSMLVSSTTTEENLSFVEMKVCVLKSPRYPLSLLGTFEFCSPGCGKNTPAKNKAARSCSFYWR